ncbi:UPF0651 protein P31B10.02, mitochondrial [Morella rubra]|uniref:UPF0651 protein P31B10.02, mitochondrial n=1 Tax=Morella rubra TaxID=262757 RepID=A0A6A1UW10_9ROSI|nr:UPF0651 protein P31B10.02, mitochondrial [Morella rubra]
METTAHHPVVSYTSQTLHRHLPKPEHVLRIRDHFGSPMRRGADLTLRRVISNTIVAFNNRLRNPPRSFCAHGLRKPMADETTSAGQPKPESIESNKELEEGSKKELPPPPPPEKPLPGDCCGSGCVRCVWDVYYEELEDYNKLYESDSKPKSTPS